MVKLISPAPGGTLGLAFGNTTVKPYNRSRPHMGQDWEREWRDLSRPRPVVAPVSGRVTRVYAGSGRNEGWGRRVEITVPATGVRIVAALNHFESVAVREGDWVEAGDYLGEMGDSGETFGVHLHEELWINGVRVNPNTYRVIDLPGTGSTASGGGSRPFEPEGFLMTLNDAEQRELLTLMRDVQNRVRGPQDRPYDMLQSIEGGVLETRIRVRGPADQPWDMLQGINAAVTGKQPVEIDEAEFARALAPTVVALVESNQTAVIAAIKQLPAQTVKAIKDAL